MVSQVNRLGDTSNYGQVVVFTIGQVTVNAPIFGSNADQTAVAALEFRYKPTPHTNCLPNNAPPSASQHDVGSSVVLATDQNWPDALTASYLAAYLRTGVLLTPTGSLSAYTAQAIAQEGVSSVFIVGGNLAVSNGVANTAGGDSAVPVRRDGASHRRGSEPVDLERDADLGSHGG